MFDLPYFATASQYFDIGLIDLILRLLAATVIGMLIGLNRDINGKPTGMRTLALVSLGAAVVSVVAVHFEDMIDHPDALSRVVQEILQGVLTGVGFIGAGVIMHQPKEKSVSGSDNGGNCLDHPRPGYRLPPGGLAYCAGGQWENIFWAGCFKTQSKHFRGWVCFAEKFENGLNESPIKKFWGMVPFLKGPGPPPI